MVIEIRFRKSVLGDTFYELYINGVWVCGFYNLFIIFLRLHKYMRRDFNTFSMDEYERKLLNC